MTARAKRTKRLVSISHAFVELFPVDEVPYPEDTASFQDRMYAPKGHNNIARGNAPGTRNAHFSDAPKGHDNIARGNAPGTKNAHFSDAPKGHNNIARGNAPGTRNARFPPPP